MVWVRYHTCYYRKNLRAALRDAHSRLRHSHLYTCAIQTYSGYATVYYCSYATIRTIFRYRSWCDMYSSGGSCCNCLYRYRCFSCGDILEHCTEEGKSGAHRVGEASGGACAYFWILILVTPNMANSIMCMLSGSYSYMYYSAVPCSNFSIYVMHAMHNHMLIASFASSIGSSIDTIVVHIQSHTYLLLLLVKEVWVELSCALQKENIIWSLLQSQITVITLLTSKQCRKTIASTSVVSIIYIYIWYGNTLKGRLIQFL